MIKDMNHNEKNMGQDFLDAVYDVNKWIRNLFKTPASLDELMDKWSDSLDEGILARAHEQNLNYIGGQIHLVYQDEKVFLINVELYYKDSEEEYMQDQFQVEQKADILLAQDFEVLKKKGRITYEVDPPKAL